MRTGLLGYACETVAAGCANAIPDISSQLPADHRNVFRKIPGMSPPLLLSHATNGNLHLVFGTAHARLRCAQVLA
jgi:hypothetical protein